VLASCALFFVTARQLASDVFLAAAVAGFYAGWVPERSRRGLWPFVALGAGFMAKGPVVLVLTVLPVLVAAAWTRRGALARPLASVRGWLLFALIALPWYLVCVARTPGLFSYFIGNQVWERYATTAHQRGGPPWYFVPVLLGGALPWTWIALRGARQAWRAGRADAGTGLGGAVGDAGALLLAWILAPFVFLSLSGSKLPAYMLPVFPAVAVLAAQGMGCRAPACRRLTSLTLAALGVAAAVAVIVARPGVAALPPAVVVAGCIAGAALLAAAALLAGRARWTWAAAAALAALLVAVASTRPVDAALGSPRALVEVLSAERRAGEPVVEFAHFNAAVPFYLGGSVLLLEVPRERRFLGDRAIGRIWIGRGDLPVLAARMGRAWVIGPDRATVAMLRDLGLGAELRARWKGEGLFLVTGRR
jgi:4-amino-4-deoxy-L-arabinose transferase-like glycosyltransferase